MEKAFDIGDSIARENLVSEAIPELVVENELVLAVPTKDGMKVKRLRK